MQLDPQEWLQIEMLSGAAVEPQTLELFARLLRPGDTMIDVGAHVGLHALVSARLVGPGGRVLAVEPQPYNCERTMTNAAANGFRNIHVVCAAAGAESGTVVLRQQTGTDKARLTLTGEGVNDTGLTFEVPVVRLDELARRHSLQHVRLLKIDVEGFEPEVLAGARELLANLDNLVIEILPSGDDVRVGRMLDLIESAGFEFKSVTGAPWRRGEKLLESNLWACRTEASAHRETPVAS
ncbi:MAG: FkbM family methyltransferase [Phenylobacterium sp.]